MTSLNNIKRIKCENKDSDQYIKLLEYILFFNNESEDKYIVFKFKNNLDQYLYGFTFELLQYTENNKLVEKSELTYKDIKINNLESFVPDKKYKLNPLCDHIGVNIIKANFERINVDHNETTEVKFDYADYKNEVHEPSDALVAKKTKREKRKETIEIEKAKVEYTSTKIQNITNQNISNRPRSLAFVSMVIICVLAVLFSSYNYELGEAIQVGDYYYKITNTNTCSLIHYLGNEADINVESSISYSGKTYYVTEILTSAFSGNQSINNVFIKNDSNTYVLTIKSASFRGCTNLTKIQSNKEIIVESYAFSGCKKLSYVDLNSATLYANSFSISSTGYTKFYFNKADSSVSSFYNIFSGAKSNAELGIDGDDIVYYKSTVSAQFFEGITATKVTK